MPPSGLSEWRTVRSGGREYVVKRLLDVTLAGLGIIVSAPLWLLISLAVGLEDGGPVFYRQGRMGRGGRRFEVLKFRTLVENADRIVRPWMSPDSQIVTRSGRILRRTALDEMPQLWNILRGQMSFVGPRAMPVDEFELFKARIPGLSERLSVRPGLTGVAQVYGRATRDIRRKLRYDLLYVRRLSLGLDLKLILLSFWISLRGRWEGVNGQPNGAKTVRARRSGSGDSSPGASPGAVSISKETFGGR